MKWCVSFPEEELLIKRPCLRKACGGNKAAAAFLSYLLYQVSISQQYKKNAENINQRKVACGERPDQEVTFKVYRRQQEIVAEMDEEISDRTLRDTAIPLLAALGYLEVDETDKINVYAVHLDAVQAGIDHPPAMTELFPLLHRQAASGRVSDRYRKNFRRLAEGFPTATGKISALTGTISATKTGSRHSSQAGGNQFLDAPKNQERKKEGAEENGSSPSVEDAPTAAAGVFSELGTLTAAEIALVLAHRQQGRSQAVEARGTAVPEPEDAPATETVAPPDERPALAAPPDASESLPIADQPPAAPAVAPPDSRAPGEPPLTPEAALPLAAPAGDTPSAHSPAPPVVMAPVAASPQARATGEQRAAQPAAPANPAAASGLADLPQPQSALSPAALVALVEQKLSRPYDATERPRQLAAAHVIIARHPSLDQATFERVYDAGNDPWWKAHYGELHLTHLAAYEKHGTMRFSRLLARCTAPAPQAAPRQSSVPLLPALSVRIPLRAGGGMTLADARALREVIASDRRLDAHCITAIVTLDDDTYAVLADRTVTETVRQVAFYSADEWHAKAATTACASELFGLTGRPVNIAAMMQAARAAARQGVQA